MQKTAVAAGSAVVAFCAAVAFGDGALRMGKVLEFPHAGVALAAPEGFEPQNVGEPFDVLRAALLKGSKSVQAVTLSAFPVAEKVTAAGFADAMAAELRKNLAIRHAKETPRVPVRVAGIEGVGSRLSYTFRGTKTAAARVYFIRRIKSPQVRICYVLTVESTAERKSDLLPILDATIKSLKLTTVRRPRAVGVSKLGRPFKDHRHGYMIRPPLGWYITTIPAGVVLAQADYLGGSLAAPSIQVQVSVRNVLDHATSKGQATKCIETALKASAGYKVVSQGQGKLAGLPGYRFVLRGEPAAKGQTQPKGKPEPPVTILQRTACVAGAAGRPAKSYNVVLVCQGARIKELEGMMEKIASGFELLKSPAEATTSPAGGGAARDRPGELGSDAVTRRRNEGNGLLGIP